VKLGLNDPGDAAAPVGTRPWAVAMYNSQVSYKSSGEFAVRRLKWSLLDMKKHQGWAQLCDQRGHVFQSWEDFCQYREPFGLGMRMEVVEAIITEQNEKRLLKDVIAETMRAAPPHGPAKTGRPIKGTTVVPLSKGGNDRLAARIKRDHPDIAAAVERGEYPSMRQAALAAGIVKPPDPFRDLCRAWEKTPDEQRKAFVDGLVLDWLNGRNVAASVDAELAEQDAEVIEMEGGA
jgi:hypothetical protein